MKSKSINKITFTLFLFVAFGLSAQRPVEQLSSLIGMRASSLDQEMEKHGYSHVKTEKSGNDSYSNWWHAAHSSCVMVRTSDGKVASIVHSMAADCNQQEGGGSSSHGSGFNSLIDMRASYLDSEMQKLGYSHVKTEKSGNDSYSYWWNSQHGKCVTARTSNGKVASITDTMNADCNQN